MRLLTDQDIQALASMPKAIQKKDPARGYREESFQRHCEFELLATGSGGEQFEAFVRQNLVFIENFSIGLRYRTGDPVLGTVTLARYNGPHGEQSRDSDGHFALPHIHRITEAELRSGSPQPQESHREITDRYQTFDEALMAFFLDVQVMNSQDYFPSQGRLFP